MLAKEVCAIFHAAGAGGEGGVSEDGACLCIFLWMMLVGKVGETEGNGEGESGEGDDDIAVGGEGNGEGIGFNG